MIEARPSASFEAIWVSGETGLLATALLRIEDNQGAIVSGPVSPNRELGTTGVYVADLTAPAVEGQFTISWSRDGTFAAATVDAEDLVVATTASAAFPPLIPGDQLVGPVPGPCFGWVDYATVAECCNVEVGSSIDVFEAAASSASSILYRLSGKQFPGSCTRVVRPVPGMLCGLQVLASGYVIVPWETTRPLLDLSRVLLPNFPVTDIIEVKIDGVALSPDEYRLDGWRWLTRMADANGDAQSWPSSQRRDREDSEEDTFSIRYSFGQNPPQEGIDAAAQLACEIYKQCPGNEGVGADCALPKNAVRASRQGITVELGALTFTRSTGWATGMPLVDLFLNAHNPNGLKRRPMIWSPDAPRFAQEVGTALGS